MRRNLSTAEAARLLGLREHQLRALVRSGLCRPARRGHRYAFSFQDLVVLRTAQGLIEAKVPQARVHRALRSLIAELPNAQPLSGLKIFADGRRVAVRSGDEAWQPETGQLLLNFEIDDLAAQARAIRAERDVPSASEPGVAADADSEFNRGIELEDENAEAAMSAYARSIELDPMRADAHVNLGRLRHEAGRAQDAAALYHRALELSPEDPIIHYNLALALEDSGTADSAVEHYERALELDPAFADAHFNFAGLCEQLGRGPEAVQHYSAYKRLTGG